MIKITRVISLLTSLALTSWFLGFFYFVKTTSNVSNYNRNMTDAIVIFGTKDQELYAGTQLLKLGYAPLVFVTSDKPKTAFSNFFKTYNLAPEQFIFNRDLAVNTTNYSTDTAEFIRKYRLQSMRLVVG